MGGRVTPVLIVALAALTVAGCGDDSKDGGKAEGRPASGSSIDCLQTRAVGLKADEYDSPDDPGLERGTRPLFTKGARGVEILTGRLGGVAFEYPTAADAAAALRKARASKKLVIDPSPRSPAVFGRTLYIEYDGPGYVREIVAACARNPDERPPTP